LLFIATVDAVAAARPDVLTGMVRDNGDGTYDVTFQDRSLKGETTVTVDNRLYVDHDGSPKYARPGQVQPARRSLMDRILGRNKPQPVMWGARSSRRPLPGTRRALQPSTGAASASWTPARMA
jgi:hypothetical protein